MAIEQVTASASQTGTSQTYAAVNNLTITPASGDYLALAVVDMQDSSIGGSPGQHLSLFEGGTQVTESERQRDGEGSYVDLEYAIMTHGVVTPNGSQAVEVQYKRTGTDDVVFTTRNLVLFPLGTSGTDYHNDSVTTTTSTITATFATLNGMSRTPASGKFLLVFSASCQNATGNDVMEFRVTVGGVAVNYTVLQLSNYSSAVNTAMPIMIIAEIDPDGSEVVAVEWRRAVGTGTCECFERTMTLVKVNAADIKTVSSTTTTSVTTTAASLINAMTHTDPGAEDWLTLFAGWWDMTGGATDGKHRDHIYKAGAAETNGDRGFEAEESTNQWEMPVFLAQKITVAGATDDVEIFWSNSVTRTRNMYERAVILLKEAASAPLTQSGYRFYNDGSEANAHPKEDVAEDAPTGVIPNQTFGVRGQISTVGDPVSKSFKWQWQLIGDDLWEDIAD